MPCSALLDSDTIAVPDGYELSEAVASVGEEDGSEIELGWRPVVRPGERFHPPECLGLGLACRPHLSLLRQSKDGRGRPDVVHSGRGRLPNEELPSGDLRLSPDLVVEVVSPNDTVYELDTKIEEYLAAGVRLVWVINPEARIAVIHRLDGSMAKVREGQELSGEDVVPGFRCLLSACLPPLPATPTSALTMIY